MGKCRVELNVTINTGNFSSVKAQVGFEEEYLSLEGKEKEASEARREAKFQELLEVCNDKLDEAVLVGIRKIKAINQKD